MNRISFIAGAFAITALSFFLYSCQSENPLFEKNGIKIYEVNNSPEFPDAELQLLTPADNALLNEGENTFSFEVKNYSLGAQTPDAEAKLCANSAKGQHIHFILDNQPYFASYNTEIPYNLHPGNHVLLAFLSRSYHESIKTKQAYILKQFEVPPTDSTSDIKTFTSEKFDAEAPHLFYSRPKGEYIGEAEIKKVLLDFYLVNVNLSSEGYKVRATINGNEFILTKWTPYLIEGLPLGENKIKLELLDKDEKLVDSPFNGVERTFVLKTDPSKN